MRPALRYTPRRATRCCPAVTLKFRPMTLEAMEEVRRLLHQAPSRTNDYTIGGIYMWIKYFNYTYCIYHNTLFIKGVTEDDISRPAFMLPVGELPLKESVKLIREYCEAEGMGSPMLSAVPEDRLGELRVAGVSDVSELTDWADYLYDAQALATLSGKKLSKKRNHVNRFMTDNPGYCLETIDDSNIDAVRKFFDSLSLDVSKPLLAEFERTQVREVLTELGRLPFEGGVLTVPERGVVAFAIGEVIGDTLFVHIEKMDHTVSGAGETINCLFARMMTERHPEILYINREEDVGDPGLRKAKQSYHPLPLLRKFNVTL